MHQTARGLFVTTLLLFAVMILLPSRSFSAVPRVINYQGYLTAADGTPVHRSVVMRLSLYDAASGGTQLWSEQQTVQISSGQYSVNLGEVTVLSLPFDQQYYLGIRIDNDDEMTPRQAFASSPYALRSSIADSVADGGVSTRALADGSVTAAKLGIACSAGQTLVRTSGGWDCGSLASSGTGTNAGTITGVIAGAGLTGGGMLGIVTLDVNFSGTGSAATAARSDHHHDGAYQKRSGKIATVAKTGGDYTSPAEALAAIADWCGIPAADNPCMVKLMPGIYDMGPSSLVMQNYIDLEGSGSGNTVITGSIDSAASGVLNTATASVAKLSVRNAGGDGRQNAVAIYNSAPSATLVDLTATAAGAVNNYGIYNAVSSAALQNVTARGTGGSAGYGLYSAGSGTGTISVERSTLDGSTNSVASSGSASTRIFSSAFLGGPVSNTGTGDMSCVASTDDSKQFFDVHCPPALWLAVQIYPLPCSVAGCFPANGIVKAQFTYDMNPATISTATFKVIDRSSGQPVPGSVTYDPAIRTASFTPLSPLASPSYMAVVTTGVRDISGGKLQDESTSVFGSGTVDSAPLQVTDASPAPGRTIDPSAYVYITINVNKVIDTLLVSNSNMLVKNAANQAVAGTVSSWNSTIAFYPSAGFSPDETYTVTISGIKDQAGNGLAAPYVFSFYTTKVSTPANLTATAKGLQATLTWSPAPGSTSYNLYWSTVPGVTKLNGTKIANVTSPYVQTGLASGLTYYYAVTAMNGPAEGVESNQTAVSIDGIPPAIIATNPANASVNVDVAASLCVVFSKAIDVSTWSNATVAVKDGNNAAVAGTFAATDSNACFVPVVHLAYNMTYTVVVNGVQSHAGVAMTFPYTFTITTKNVGIPGNLNAAKGDLQATLTWSAAPDAASYTLYWSTIPGVTSLNGTKVANVTSPYIHTGLANGSTYYYVVTAVNGSAEGGASNETSACFNDLPPAVISTNPANAAANVNIAASVCVVFNKAIDGNSWNNSTVSLKDGNNNAVAGTFSSNGANACFIPGAPLAYGMTYGVSVSGVLNEAGTAMAAPHAFNFATMPVGAPTGLSAADGDLQTTLTWSPVLGATSYNVYWSTAPSVTKLNGTKITNVTSPYTHTGLANNMTYYYIVTAVNGAAEGAASNQASAYIGIVPPDAPANLTASANGLQATLAWSPVSGATSYDLYWSVASGVTKMNGVKIGNVTSPYTHTGLSTNMTYYYIVVAKNNQIESQASNQAWVRVDNLQLSLTTLPQNGQTDFNAGSPLCFYFSKVDRTQGIGYQAVIDAKTWNDGTVSIKDEQGSVVPGMYLVQDIDAYSCGSRGISFVPVPALALNMGYTVIVNGVKDTNGNGLPAPYTFSFMTKGIGKSALLTAAAGDLQATLTWQPVVGAASYNIYWATSPGVTKLNGTKITNAANPFTHTGLADNTKYYYVVTALDSSSEGRESNETSVVFDTTPPTVASTIPAANETNVYVHPFLPSDIIVTFNEAVNGMYLPAVTLQDGAGNAVIMHVMCGGTACYISPGEPFTYSTTYTVTISGVADLMGNTMSSPYSFSFTTKAP